MMTSSVDILADFRIDFLPGMKSSMLTLPG